MTSFLDSNGRATDQAGDQVFLFPPGFVDSSLFVGSGGQSLQHTTGYEGYYTVGVGLRCLTNVTTGSYNTGTGFEVMDALLDGHRNTGHGEAVLCYNLHGCDNTGNGYKVLLQSQGNDNTASGSQALLDLVSGWGNFAGGKDCGRGLVNGNYNVFLGKVTVTDPAMSNAVIIADGQGNERLHLTPFTTVVNGIDVYSLVTRIAALEAKLAAHGIT